MAAVHASGRALRAVLAWGLVVGATAGCDNLARQGGACSVASDCHFPLVCCSEPRLPRDGQAIPSCEKFNSCDAYLPFLVEGNPCERGGPGPAGIQTCGDGLVCCLKTRVCQTVASCEATPEPEPLVCPAPGETPSWEKDCSADTDCVEGATCQGIDLLHRDGRCTAPCRE